MLSYVLDYPGVGKVFNVLGSGATRNSNSTDKPEVDGALILLPPLHQCPFYGYLNGKERSRNKDARYGNRRSRTN